VKFQDQYETTLGPNCMYLKERPEKQFLICPGEIASRSDGQLHYIGVRQLQNLYGVRSEECIVDSPHNRVEGLLYLEPSYEGDYSLPDVFHDPCEPYRIVPDSICCALVLQACAFLFRIIPV